MVTGGPAFFAELRDQIVVVTGSSSGVGRGIAVAVAAAGANVIVHCRENEALAARTAEQIRATGRSLAPGREGSP